MMRSTWRTTYAAYNPPSTANVKIMSARRRGAGVRTAGIDAGYREQVTGDSEGEAAHGRVAKTLGSCVTVKVCRLSLPRTASPLTRIADRIFLALLHL